MMALFRPLSLQAFLLIMTQATPILDLSQDAIRDACQLTDFDANDEIDGIMVLHKGANLFEWRNPFSQVEDERGVNFKEGTTQHNQFSVTKTWTSVLVGMLYRDGFLDWETEHPDKITLGDIFSDEYVWDEMWDIPYLIHGGSKVQELKSITLGALMSMRTGYGEKSWLGSSKDSSLVQAFDGLVAWWHAQYKDGDIDSQMCFDCGDYLPKTNILNYIIKEKTRTLSNPRGWDPLDYARQTSLTLPNGNIGLFEALGMETGSYTWDRDEDFVATSAYGLWVDLADMAKFGQLLLQGGTVLMEGQSKDIIPSSYLEEMTTTQSRMTKTLEPYGWHVWIYDNDTIGGFYCAQGLGWQSICVFPEDETVIAIQASLQMNAQAFHASVKLIKEALEKIKDGLVCSPTSAPTASINSPDSSAAPTASSTSQMDESEEAGLDFVQEKQNESQLGLILGLVLTFAVLFVLAFLLFFKRRSNKKDDTTTTSVDAYVVPDNTAFEEANRMVNIDLGLEEEDSVETVEMFEQP